MEDRTDKRKFEDWGSGATNGGKKASKDVADADQDDVEIDLQGRGAGGGSRGAKGYLKNGVLYTPEAFTTNDMILGCENTNMKINVFGVGEMMSWDLDGHRAYLRIMEEFVPKYMELARERGPSFINRHQSEFAAVSFLVVTGPERNVWRYDTDAENMRKVSRKEAIKYVQDNFFNLIHTVPMDD